MFCGGIIIHVFDRSLASDENGIAAVGIAIVVVIIIVVVRFRSLAGRLAARILPTVVGIASGRMIRRIAGSCRGRRRNIDGRR